MIFKFLHILSLYLDGVITVWLFMNVVVHHISPWRYVAPLGISILVAAAMPTFIFHYGIGWWDEIVIPAAGSLLYSGLIISLLYLLYKQKHKRYEI